MGGALYVGGATEGGASFMSDDVISTCQHGDTL